MKKSLPLILVLLLLIVIKSNGQITTTIIKHIDKPVEQSVKYDGYSNIAQQKREIDYQQYVGIKAYVPKGSNLDNQPLKKSAYFTIVGVKKTGVFGGGDRVDFELLSDESKDNHEYSTILEYSTQSNDGEDDVNLILVPYFLHEKKVHDGENYVVVNKGGSFYDEASDSKISYSGPLFNGAWTCEVSMHEYGEEKDHERLEYLYKDTAGHVVYQNVLIVKHLDDGEIGVKNRFYTYDTDNLMRLMPLELYNAVVNAEGKRLIKKKSNNAKSLSVLIAKYGNENATLITQGKVKIGMNSEMCNIAWGGLYGIVSRVQESSGTNEVWKHAIYGTLLYFKNGKLYKIVN
jgi:hypothetical protein